VDAQWVADRSHLGALLTHCPEWTTAQYAHATGRSISWVKKWKKRFAAHPNDPDIVWGDARRAHTVAPSFDPGVIDCILAIRDTPPEGLQRTPGPKAILYYLPRSPDVPPGCRLPRSTRTVWSILRAHQRIAQSPVLHHQPQERPAALAEWQIDFKDLTSVPCDPEGKQLHGVETLDVIDVGTSLWLLSDPAPDYAAHTVFAPLLQALAEYGLPDRVRFDRDPRFVGSAGMLDFPSPFVRFWYALGIRPIINPPHTPELNAFVERLHGTIEREYVQREYPDSLDTAREGLHVFRQHYNAQRPHQGITCGNRPPQVAHPSLPVRPSLPLIVDPDAWLVAYDGRFFARHVKSTGSIMLDNLPYYVGQQWKGRDVVVKLQAESRELHIFVGERPIKRLAIKGLVGEPMGVQAFVEWCGREAYALWRHYLRRQRLKHAS
jgi:hypothetical protein